MGLIYSYNSLQCSGWMLFCDNFNKYLNSKWRWNKMSLTTRQNLDYFSRTSSRKSAKLFSKTFCHTYSVIQYMLLILAQSSKHIMHLHACYRCAHHTAYPCYKFLHCWQFSGATTFLISSCIVQVKMIKILFSFWQRATCTVNGLFYKHLWSWPMQ